jgi:hypothetical protein
MFRQSSAGKHKLGDGVHECSGCAEQQLQVSAGLMVLDACTDCGVDCTTGQSCAAVVFAGAFGLQAVTGFHMHVQQEYVRTAHWAGTAG